MARGSYAKAYGRQALGQGLLGIGDLLMSAASNREAREYRDAQTARQEERDKLEQERWQATQERLADQTSYQRERDQVADQRYRRGEIGNALARRAELMGEGYELYDSRPQIGSLGTSGADVGVMLAGAAARPKMDTNVPMNMVKSAPPPSFRVSGREFPETPEGQKNALDWARDLGSAGRAPPEAEAAVFSEGVLRDAGVPEHLTPVALADPVLARSLIRDANEDEGWSELDDALAGVGAEPEREPVQVGTWDPRRLLPGYESRGANAQEPSGRLRGPPQPDSASAVEPASAIPEWFRAQHPALVEQGAPEDIEEAWQQYQGGL